MVIEPTNQTNTAILSRSEKDITPDTIQDSNANNAGIPEAGQTSEIAPAVVANISTATLETSRAINAPEQIAEQNKTADIVKAQDKEQLNRVEDTSPKGPEPPKKSMIDTAA